MHAFQWKNHLSPFQTGNSSALGELRKADRVDSVDAGSKDCLMQIYTESNCANQMCARNEWVANNCKHSQLILHAAQKGFEHCGNGGKFFGNDEFLLWSADHSDHGRRRGYFMSRCFWAVWAWCSLLYSPCTTCSMTPGITVLKKRKLYIW